ncbi:MAG TPA: hypothetical protein VK469_05255 [Candidatus Kapabacteria bacterium]|nr:hypothetical protein [Candidatus Kapabacteria bacterium]
MFKELLISIARQFEKHNIPYIIVGGQLKTLSFEEKDLLKNFNQLLNEI